MKRIIPLLFAILATVPFASNAQWYVGGGIGQGKTKLQNESRSAQFLDLGFDSAQTTGDDSDTAYRLFAGYQVHRFMALEGGYTDLGRFEQHSFVAPAGRLDSRTRVGLVDLSVLGLLPLGDRFTLFARGGGFGSRTRTSYEGSGSVAIVEGSNGSKRTSGFVFGGGASAAITPRVAIRLDWMRYRRAIDDALSNRQDADVWMLGVTYRF